MAASVVRVRSNTIDIHWLAYLVLLYIYPMGSFSVAIRQVFAGSLLNVPGWVVQKPVNANLGLKVNQGFCFSRYKAFALLILSSSLKEVKVKF